MLLGDGLVGDGKKDEYETVDRDEHVEPRGERIDRVHADRDREAPELGGDLEIEIGQARVDETQRARVDIEYVDDCFCAKEKTRTVVVEDFRRENRIA